MKEKDGRMKKEKENTAQRGSKGARKERVENKNKKEKKI